MIATVVGNYPKVGEQPGGQRLRRAITQYDGGRITLQQLQEVADEVTKEVIEEQVKAGLDLVTDGQIRWDDGITYFTQNIEGFEITGLVRFFDTNTYYRQPIAVGPLRWNKPILLRDYQLAVALSPRPVKAVLTGPYTIARLSRTQHHSDLRSYVLNLAQVLNQEARTLQEAGAPLIQFDEPAIVKNKADWSIFQEAMVALTAGLSVKTALYTYFGDVTGLPDFFQSPFQVFGLDFVMGPSNFNLVPSFPRDKELALGIMDARDMKMESVDYIATTISNVSQHVGEDRIYINPNCGLEFLPRNTAYAKLCRMVEGIKKGKEVAV